MGTIKLDKDEMLKIAGELSVLKEEINYILNKLSETENVLRRENSVSTYSQERKLSDLQDLAYNLVREFDKISDNFYQAAKAYESTEDKLTNLVNINKDNNIKNIIAVNSMENTFFNSDNTKSEEKEETTFDKLKELVQEGWQLVKDYYGLKIAVMDFVKDICDNINTCIDGYIKSHEEFFEEFNEEHPILSVICFPLQQLVAVRDVTLNFLKEMTFELVSSIFGMLSYEYHGLIENPDETIKENIQSILIIKAILSPTSKGEVEIRDRFLLGIWEDIKADFNSEVINGNPYTASRYVYNLAIEIGSLFYGAGELKAAAGVKKADNVIDGLRAIDKVSDAKKLSNGDRLLFNEVRKSKNFYRKNISDPIRDILGSGLKSNPKEWNKLIDEMASNGVEIVYRDGTMAYSPGLVPGAPGQLIIDKDASMSALIHEYQHYLDDVASGLPGMRQLYEQNPRIIKELRAYTKEIKIADELGLREVSAQLWENYRQEREYILNLFKE